MNFRYKMRNKNSLTLAWFEYFMSAPENRYLICKIEIYVKSILKQIKQTISLRHNFLFMFTIHQ